MKSLCFVSIVFSLCFAGCQPRFARVAQGNSSISKEFSLSVLWTHEDTTNKPIQYNTHVNFYGKRIDGLLLLQRMSTDLYRASFLASGTYKLFELEILEDTFRFVQHAQELANPHAQRRLAHDLFLLTRGLHQSFSAQEITVKDEIWLKGVHANYNLYFRLIDGKLLEVKETDTKDREYTSIYLSDYENDTPRKIFLKHASFRMEISMEKR